MLRTLRTLSDRLWTLTKDGRVCTCDMAEHAQGFEAAYHVDDLLVRSQVFTDTAALTCHANDAREAFEALGWLPDEPS
jgi:hypothetical protein